jgi:hypothetical protein
MSKHILIGTNTYNKYERQDLCIESFKKLKDKNTNVDICLIQEPDDVVYYYDISVIRKLKRNSSSILNTDKKLPFVNDIFDVLCEHSKDYFVFCNSDIILSQQLINHIILNDIEALGISRIEIPPIRSLIETFTPIRMEPSGFDCWVVSKNWWLKHRHLFKDYLLGRPYFDVHYTLLMLLNSNNIYISNQYLIYHIMHKSPAFVEDVCSLFNKKQTFDHYANNDKLWGDFCNNTFFKRRDLGKFLMFNPEEPNIINSIKDEYRNRTIK